MAERTCSVPECGKKHLARGYCGTHYNQFCITKQQRHPKHVAPCVVCGTEVERYKHSKYANTSCSPRCRSIVEWGCWSGGSDYDWTNGAMVRAAAAGATVIERVDRMVVFERDKWTCYICQAPVALANGTFTPASATVDHVIPLSLGGAHTYDNVRACCSSCNSAKHDSVPTPLSDLGGMPE